MSEVEAAVNRAAKAMHDVAHAGAIPALPTWHARPEAYRAAWRDIARAGVVAALESVSP